MKLRVNHRAKAFTILELMVALVISSIVIGFTYYALEFINLQSQRKQKKVAALNDWFLFKKAFDNDLLKADKVSDSAGLLLLAGNQWNGRILYETGQGPIKRITPLSVDSFAIVIKDRQFVYEPGATGIITNIFIDADIAGESLRAVFTKEYSSRQLMNVNANE